MRAFIIALTLGGLVVLARKRTGTRQPTLPLTRREYEDRLANRLEVALSYGDRQMWDEVSAECRKAGRSDLPELKRKERSEWAERLDRA